MQLPQPSLVDLVVPVTPYPWKDYTGIASVLPVLKGLAEVKGRSWAPLPLSIVTAEAKDDDDAPQRALARQVLRAQNEVLMRLANASSDKPTNPTDAVARLIPRFTADQKHPELNEMFGTLLRVDMFSRRFKQQDDNVLDVRDFGPGLDRHSLLDIFEPVEHACALKHRLMAQASYEHAPYTLVASRRAGRPVAVTIIWRSSTGDRYFHLVERDGGAPTLNVPEEQFPVGTLIRHIGFEAPFYNSFKENSVQGALDRILPGMSFPVATFYHDLGAEPPKAQHRLAMGAVQRLAGWVTEGKARHSTTTRVVAEESCQVYRYEFLHPDGTAAGNDALRHHCRPTDPVLFMQDGQTIATAARPPQLQVPTLLVIDVSPLSPTKLQRVRTDRPWRNELVRAALNRSRQPAVEMPIGDAPALDVDADVPIHLRTVNVRRWIGR